MASVFGNATAAISCNISRSTASPPYPLSLEYILVMVFICLTVVCILGNIVTLIILRRWSRIKTSAANIILFSVALSDLFGIFCGFPTYVLDHQVMFGLNWENIQHLMAIRGAAWWGRLLTLYFSDLLLVAFSVRRLRHFCKGLRSTPETPRGSSFRVKVILSIMVLGLLSGLLCLHVPVAEYHYRFGILDCRYRRPKWIKHWFRIMDHFEAAFPFCIFIVLAILNISLVNLIQKNQRAGGALQRSVSDTVRAEARPTRILIASVVMYLITQIPVVLLHVTDLVCKHQKLCLFTKRSYMHTDPVYTALSATFYHLSLVNYTADFVLYLGVSTKFREDVLDLVTRCLGRQSARTGSRRYEGSYVVTWKSPKPKLDRAAATKLDLTSECTAHTAITMALPSPL